MRKNVKIIIPATFVCILPWMLNGFPVTPPWMISLVLCGCVDLVFWKGNTRG